jgi:hypothetical protein
MRKVLVLTAALLAVCVASSFAMKQTLTPSSRKRATGSRPIRPGGRCPPRRPSTSVAGTRTTSCAAGPELKASR